MPEYNDPIKNAYKHLWKPGSRREETVKGLLESWGFEVHPYGFMALSDEYNPEWSKEKGVPDLFITNKKGQQLFVEVTGTDNLKLSDRLWIRHHKIDWAKNNPDKTVFCAHVISRTKTIRFVKLTDFETDIVPKEVKVLYDIPTTFYMIPWNLVITMNDMKNKLMAWRDRL